MRFGRLPTRTYPGKRATERAIRGVRALKRSAGQPLDAPPGVLLLLRAHSHVVELQSARMLDSSRDARLCLVFPL
jgi:hypothetical protein